MRNLFVFTILFLFSGALQAQPLSENLKIAHLTGDFYIFTTYNLYKGNRIPANGMYLVTKDGAVLFDSPWDSTQFQPLLDSILIKHHKQVVMCIATHFHEDRTGGLEFYAAKGIKTYSTKRTDELSRLRGMKRAAFLIRDDTTFNIGNNRFETFYPGAGHAPDNIVIWFGKERILYGGCLVKSMEDDNLGNLSDANVKAYPLTLQKVIEKYKNPRFVIPGHDDWTNSNSLKHTLKMAKALANQD